MFFCKLDLYKLVSTFYLHIYELEFTEVVGKFLDIRSCVGGVVCGGRLGDERCHRRGLSDFLK